MKHLGDITQINGSMVEPVNVIIGGSPCQDLSVAGRRAGLARTYLWPAGVPVLPVNGPGSLWSKSEL